ncbi:hypothetical protein [Kibdelosporangium phytohabitans]|uniref:Uncharacterized protein n=1 Tax=Kibdelosporangium phytohabitans TaxID=860235 RepID=A0A0N9HU34_9PSEU|nr:hypothetical protein [Kibdelosporangium phytohabitans]ALG06864.1 hypothetical protein AOZ06_07885 [Kibdelosporangium phytohabitans]MBE1468111.1 hypothetical protein [Kibdelosporangium phytohabitans]
MPLPGSITMVQVVEDYRRADGTVPVGAVTFIPAVRSTVAGSSIIVEPVTVALVDGQLAISLAWQGDPNLTPRDWTYTVVEAIGGETRTRTISLPSSGPVVLHTLADLDPVVPTEVRVRTVEGIRPDSTGNIDLPAAAGSAPATRVIAATGGLQGGGDLSADRTISPLYGSTADTVCEGDDPRLSNPRTPTAHDHAVSAVTGLQPALDGKEAVGTAAATLAAHVAAVDPHSQYLTTAEAAALFAALVHSHGQSDITGLVSALAAKQNQLVMRDAYVKLGSATNINLNTGSSSWGALPTFPTLSIPAAVGDKVGLAVNGIRQANSNLLMDFGVVVSGVIKRWLGGNYTDTSPPPSSPAYEGDPAMYHTNVPSISCERRFTVTANDRDGSGNVVFAVLCRVAGAGSALLLCSNENPYYWSATNYGVVA